MAPMSQVYWLHRLIFLFPEIIFSSEMLFSTGSIKNQSEQELH